MTLLYALLASIICSLISLVGIALLGLKEEVLKKIILILVAFSSGTLLGSAFLHLIPEVLEKGEESTLPITNESIFTFIIIGICFFFFIEKILKWRHCHELDCPVHTFTYINLIGDGFHNFLDGVIILSAFISSYTLGITTTLAVILHEIPQEMGDFGVLLHGGFTRKKALLHNLLSASLSIVGVLIAYLFASYLINNLVFLIIPLSAGGFIYLACSDLLPQLHHRHDSPQESFYQLFYILLGVLVMWGIKTIFHLH